MLHLFSIYWQIMLTTIDIGVHREDFNWDEHGMDIINRTQETTEFLLYKPSPHESFEQTTMKK